MQDLNVPEKPLTGLKDIEDAEEEINQITSTKVRNRVRLLRTRNGAQGVSDRLCVPATRSIRIMHGAQGHVQPRGNP